MEVHAMQKALPDKINDELSSHPNIDTISMGIFDLKNVNRNVEECFLLQSIKKGRVGYQPKKYCFRSNV